MNSYVKRTLSALLCLALVLTMLPLSSAAEDENYEPYIEVKTDAMYGAAKGNSMVFGGLIYYPPDGLNSWNSITVEGDISDGALLADCNPGSGSEDTNYATFRITVPETTAAGEYNIYLKIEQQLDTGVWRHITSDTFTFQVFDKDSEVFVITPNQEVVTKGNVFYGSIATENHVWGLDWYARPSDVEHWMNNEYGLFSLEDVTVNNLPDGITANAWIPVSGPNAAFICIETDNLPVGTHTVTVTCAGVTSNEFDIVVTEPDAPEIVGIEVFSDSSGISYYDMRVVGENETILGTPIQVVVRASYSDGSDEFLHAGALDFYIEEGSIPLMCTEIDNDPEKPYIQIQTDSLTSGILNLGVSLKSNPLITGSITINLLDYVIFTCVEGQDAPPFMATVHTGQAVQLSYRVFPENYDESSLVMSDWQREYPGGSIGTDSFISQDGELSIGLDETAESFFITPPFHWENQSGQFLLVAPEIRIVSTPRSDDATLSSLIVSAGELSPAFSPDTTDYTVTVPYSADSINITAIVNDINAAVSGAGSKALVVGENTLRVVVFAEDGSDKTYTITVTREAPPENGDFVIDVSSLNGDISNENWFYNHTSGTITLTKDVFIIGEKTDADRTLVINIPANLTAIWKADYSGSTAESNALVELRGRGTFDVADGNITQTGGGNAVYIPYNGTDAELEFRGKLNINGGEISVTNGHAIYREGPDTGNGYYCDINISGGTIRRTGGNADGSAIHYGLAYLTMTGGEIISSGWCIDAYFSRSLRIEDGTVKSTASAIRGNTIFDIFNMYGGVVEANNDAVYTRAGAIIEGGTVTAGDFAVYVDESLTRYDVYVAYLAGTILNGEVRRPDMAYATVVEVDTLAIPLDRHGTSTGITELCIPTGVTWKVATWDLLHWDNLPSLHFQPTLSAHAWRGWGHIAENESGGISLDKSDTQTFPAATYGYVTAPIALTVTVSNTGNQATGALSIALSGDTAAFTLSKTSIGTVSVGGNDLFTVRPSTGLSAGTYTATVTVGGASVASQSFTVSFTVDKKPLENAMIDAIAAQTYSGSQLSPPITVQDGGTALTLNTDYENVTYGANVNAGTNAGSVTITGKGNYSGIATANFTISPAPLTLTADNKTINVGDGEPLYTFTVSGMQGSDTAAVVITAPTLSVADFSSAAEGSFTITISGGEASSNYTISSRVNGTLTVSALPKEAAPSAAINFTSERLTGLVADAAYSVNGGVNISADGSGTAAIDSSWFDTTISIVRKGDGVTKTDSDAQSLSIPPRPAAPLTPVGGTGQISGVDGTMEYKPGAASVWTTVSGGTVSGLAAGDYQVRIKATATAFASESVSVTVTAARFTVSFDANGGTVSPSSMQTGTDGKLVSLPTPTRSGSYSFDGWYTAASGGVLITASTTFAANTTVYAIWTYTGGNNNSGGGTGGTTTAPDAPDAPAAEASVDADVNGGSIPVTQNTETGAVNTELGKAEADKAIENASETGGVTITIPKTATIDEKTPVSATIASEAMLSIAESGAAFTIEAPAVSMTFDADALDAIAGAGEVLISAGFAASDDLNARQKEAAGDRPVYDFTVKVDGKTVSRLGGNVKVSLPYTPQPGEDTNAIIVRYIDADGNVQTVKSCVYDEATGKISFITDHFSLYMIDCKIVSFGDVPNDYWARNYITFVAARELFSGSGNGGFDPNGFMTRSMFAAVLARMDSADLSGYTSSRFADVELGKWYTAPVEWAVNSEIINGVGNGMFDPDSPVTREQMALMLYNYMKYKGITIPSDRAAAFADENAVSSWAFEAVSAIHTIGIISGKQDNIFDPQATTTRAEVAAIFARLAQYLANGNSDGR